MPSKPLAKSTSRKSANGVVASSGPVCAIALESMKRGPERAPQPDGCQELFVALGDVVSAVGIVKTSFLEKRAQHWKGKPIWTKPAEGNGSARNPSNTFHIRRVMVEAEVESRVPTKVKP